MINPKSKISKVWLFSRNSDNDPKTEFDLNTVIEETLELCHEKFKNAGVPIHCDFTNSEKILGHSTQLSQVLMNLLTNAFDAIENLEDRWVKIETLKSNQKIKIIVTDSGLGIPQEIIAKMMQPFFTTKEVGKGTGLGLSISNGIIESHGGRFYYDDFQKHTTFVIELPLISETQQKIA